MHHAIVQQLGKNYLQLLTKAEELELAIEIDLLEREAHQILSLPVWIRAGIEMCIWVISFVVL